MAYNPQFWTRWVPFAQAGDRHRSFVINSDAVNAAWNGFSRPLRSVDISGVKTVADVIDLGNADPTIPVSVITWNPLNTVNARVNVTSHYMIQRGKASGLDYIPAYANERLQEQSRLYFWTAPPLFGTESLTAFYMQIKVYGLENPFDASGYLRAPFAIPIVSTNLLYSVDYPFNPQPSFTFPNPIS